MMTGEVCDRPGFSGKVVRDSLSKELAFELSTE